MKWSLTNALTGTDHRQTTGTVMNDKKEWIKWCVYECYLCVLFLLPPVGGAVFWPCVLGPECQPVWSCWIHYSQSRRAVPLLEPLQRWSKMIYHTEVYYHWSTVLHRAHYSTNSLSLPLKHGSCSPVCAGQELKDDVPASTFWKWASNICVWVPYEHPF